MPTIKRRLRQAHLHRQKPTTKAFLTLEAKQNKLEFARLNWRLDRKRFMFTDEVNTEISAHEMNWVRRHQALDMIPNTSVK